MKNNCAAMLMLFCTTCIFPVTAKANSYLTDTIAVNGVCDECEERIESYAMGKGVKKADWSQTTHLLIVSFDPLKTSTEDIQKRIATAGHDTELFKATEKAYKALPKCCQYDRK